MAATSSIRAVRGTTISMAESGSGEVSEMLRSTGGSMHAGGSMHTGGHAILRPGLGMEVVIADTSFSNLTRGWYATLSEG